jgi:hypothetical protein
MTDQTKKYNARMRERSKQNRESRLAAAKAKTLAKCDRLSLEIRDHLAGCKKMPLSILQWWR